MKIQRDMPALRTLSEGKDPFESRVEAQMLLDKALGMAQKDPQQAYSLALKAVRASDSKPLQMAAKALADALQQYVNVLKGLQDANKK